MKTSMRNFIPYIILPAVLLCSCGNGREKEIFQGSIPFPRTAVIRLDSLIYDTRVPLEVLRKINGEFFSEGLTDEMVAARRSDSLLTSAYGKVKTAFTDLRSIEKSLDSMFTRIKYYFPQWEYPAVYTYMSEWDFSSQALYSHESSSLYLPLDLYLGPQDELYTGIYPYLLRYLDRRYMAPNVARAIAEDFAGSGAGKGYRLIDLMAYYGKILYLGGLFLGTDDTALLLGYDVEQIGWARANEQSVWKYFVGNDMLFASDKAYEGRFFDPAPFSKFYTEADREAPWGIGRYLGLEMVRRYVERHPGTTPAELAALSADSVLEGSKYKP